MSCVSAPQNFSYTWARYLALAGPRTIVETLSSRISLGPGTAPTQLTYQEEMVLKCRAERLAGVSLSPPRTCRKQSRGFHRVAMSASNKKRTALSSPLWRKRSATPHDTSPRRLPGQTTHRTRLMAFERSCPRPSLFPISILTHRKRAWYVEKH